MRAMAVMDGEPFSKRLIGRGQLERRSRIFRIWLDDAEFQQQQQQRLIVSPPCRPVEREAPATASTTSRRQT